MNQGKAYRGFKKLDEVVFKLNKSVIGKKGVYYHKILKDWSSIVGSGLAEYVIPTKISVSRAKKSPENILYLATNNSAAATELVYQLGIIKEQINLYFGRDYIQGIKIDQAVFLVRNKKLIEEEKTLNSEQVSRVECLIAEYKVDDNIKDILSNFAKAIISRSYH